MTDKQIRIDGVDVSGCEFLIINNDRQLCRCIKSDLFGGIEFVENAKNGSCKDNSNCYYKQLKRKEQECYKYKQALDEIERYLDAQQKYFDGEDYHNLLDIIDKAKKK